MQHLNELDGNHQAEVVAVMKAVVSTCRALSHSSHDSHAHYTRSFESILQTCFAQLPLLGMTMQSNSGMYGQVNDPLDSNSNTNGSSLSAPPPSATSNGLSSGNAAPHVGRSPDAQNLRSIPLTLFVYLNQMPMDEIWRDFMPGLGNHLLGVRHLTSGISCQERCSCIRSSCSGSTPLRNRWKTPFSNFLFAGDKKGKQNAVVGMCAHSKHMLDLKSVLHCKGLFTGQ